MPIRFLNPYGSTGLSEYDIIEVVETGTLVNTYLHILKIYMIISQIYNYKNYKFLEATFPNMILRPFTSIKSLK